MVKLKTVFQKYFRKENLLLLLLIGVLLFVIVLPVKEKNTNETVETDQILEEDDLYVEDMAKKLTEILQQMEGVGRVKVMITKAASSEYVTEQGYAQNDLFSRGKGSYVTKIKAPRVEGVVVIAEGGSGKIRWEITEMVEALFGIEAHKVKVEKMAAGGTADTYSQ